jgi:hypothetical protein
MNDIENKFAELQKIIDSDPEFKKCLEEADQAYKKMLRGPDIPEDWTYVCRWTNLQTFTDLEKILDREMKTVVFSIFENDDVHFTSFISPIGLEKLKKLVEPTNDASK